MNVSCNFDDATIFSNNIKNSEEQTILNNFKIKLKNSCYRSNTISSYQTCIMMMTITAISAVDFKIFPSRFRKSKTYGLSLVKFINFKYFCLLFAIKIRTNFRWILAYPLS